MNVMNIIIHCVIIVKENMIMNNQAIIKFFILNKEYNIFDLLYLFH